MNIIDKLKSSCLEVKVYLLSFEYKYMHMLVKDGGFIKNCKIVSNFSLVT